MRLPKSRTAAAVPLVAAIDPAALSAAFASSSSATIFASDQVPDDDVLLAAPAIADVSVLMVVLDAAVVSTALLSFLPHAASASTARPRTVTLVVALVIMLFFPPIRSRNFAPALRRFI